MTGQTIFSSSTYIDHERGVVVEDGIEFPIDYYFKNIDKPNRDFTRLLAKNAVINSARKNLDNGKKS
jgi:hypothetical protein